MISARETVIDLRAAHDRRDRRALPAGVGAVVDALSPSSTGTIDLGHLQWSNFVTAWQQAGFTQYLKSSLIITGSVVVLGTIVSPS